jgi:hypothetical protein
MRKPRFTPRGASPLERVLRLHRPRPRGEFEEALVRRVQGDARRSGRALRPLVAAGIAAGVLLTGTAASLAGLGGTSALSAAVGALGDLGPVIAGNGGADKVAICHATGSTTNPYVLIEPSAAGVYNGHLATSQGGNGGADHQGAEDIIPPFEYQGQTYSQNWDAAGMAIFENDCEVPVQHDNPVD